MRGVRLSLAGASRKAGRIAWVVGRAPFDPSG